MTAPQDPGLRAEEIRRRFREATSDGRHLRARDAAAAIGVSEMELVAAGAGCRARRLRPDWPALFRAVAAMGEAMALTRNESCVHEKTGVYGPMESAHGKIGLVLGEAIDLRLFFDRWHHAYAVEVEGPRGTLRSFQMFDEAGMAIHKAYGTAASDAAAFETAAAALAEAAADLPAVRPPAPRAAPKPDEQVDQAAFRAGWRALKDTHDFHPLLRKFGLAREQALRLGGTELARPAVTDAMRRVLEEAARTGLEIMVFVGNPGCIQIHTGPVRRVAEQGHWLNVLDPGFNLHLRTDRIASAWVVRKPGDNGVVTSLELFDAEGENILMAFGKRKPGQAELPAWRDLVEALPAPMRRAA
jgi:putative hemin transport protein